MGVLSGCCKLSLAVGVVPLSVIIAAFLETPAVVELEPGFSEAAAAEAAAGAAAGASAEEGASQQQDFGRPEVEGFGSGNMFDRIAFAYDHTNKFMSLGLDQAWRNALVKDCMQLSRDDRVLDLATGTADVSLLVGGRLRELGAESSEGPSVVGIDPSAEMLRRGVAKVDGRGFQGAIRLVKGDAQDLSSVRSVDAEGVLGEPSTGVANDSIDKISMSFGIRNVPDRARAFREMRRVLRPSGSSKVCILEFSLPTGDTFLSRVAKTFVTQVVPFIGRVATFGSGGKEYEYLERSILKFPQPRAFAASMAREGLHVRSITSFAFGAVHLYAASPEMPAR